MNSPVRSLLVTGGAGFIGANFVHHWHRNHPTEPIVVLDALTYAGNRMSLSSLEGTPGFTFIHGSITDQGLVETTLREHRADTVVHFAAESHVDRSILGPDLFIETNIVGTHSLLKACRQVWLLEKRVAQHRFHHVSTDEVYGSLGPTESRVSRRHAIRTKLTIRRKQSRVGSSRSCLRPYVRARDDDDELFEQLRSVPFPGEANSPRHR